MAVKPVAMQLRSRSVTIQIQKTLPSFKTKLAGPAGVATGLPALKKPAIRR